MTQGRCEPGEKLLLPSEEWYLPSQMGGNGTLSLKAC